MARLRRSVTRAVDGDAVLRRQEKAVIACSGGPDSTALLDVLHRLAPTRGWQLAVAYVDHGLRVDSAAEAGKVARLAERYGLPFAALEVKVERQGSLQEAARRARYAALERLADDLGADAIAVGHTADDQAETVLMRALSGATARSLAGMSARRGRIARPLLRVWRQEILQYCAALGLHPLEDPSNRDPRFLRTRIRYELIPALETVFPAARRRLVVLADHQRELLARSGESPGDDDSVWWEDAAGTLSSTK